MSESILSGVQMVTVALRVRDLNATVHWYQQKLGLTPIHRGADGDTPPYAAYDIGGVVVTVWQLFEGQDRCTQNPDLNSYVILVYSGNIVALRDRLLAAGVTVGRLRQTTNNRFFWFYDPDENRWEVSQAATVEQEATQVDILERHTIPKGHGRGLE